MKKIKVALGPRSYPIHIGSGLIKTLGLQCARLKLGPTCAIITDSHVGPLYAAAVQKSLKAKGFWGITITVPAGETSKSLHALEQCHSEMAAAGLDRDCFIVALGGGVVGDLAGFVAATYMRGVDFVQVPTTLLAQVDSSVGGKTGVNLPEGKNLVGAFHQPRLVLADTDTLRTLTPRVYRSGFGEIIKIAATSDATLFSTLERHMSRLLDQDASTLATVIARACTLKAAIVAQDEKESGSRAILNFGHTLGHALEKALGYGHLLHGEAIALGVIFATSLSTHLCNLSPASAHRIESLLCQAGLPTTLELTTAQAKDLFAALAVDKKSHDGTPVFVLLPRLGAASYGHPIPLDFIRDSLRA